jgi:putative intracellular protease/amidase
MKKQGVKMFKKSCMMIVVIFATMSCVSERNQGVNILMLTPQSLGANYYLLRDVIEEYGWDVTHTGVSDTIAPCPWFAAHGKVYPVVPEVRVEDITDIKDYDCLLIAPSTGNAAPVPNSNSDLLESKEALMLIKRAAYFNLPVFATCAGVRVLAAADVIRDKFIIGSPRFRDEYVAAGANYVGRPQNDNPPTIDGNIITCARGQYYNYANVMAIATVLEGNQNRGYLRNNDAGHIVSGDIDLFHDDVVWAKAYGGPGSDGGRALCSTPDGGYLLVGYTFAPGLRDADMLVIKTDAQGDIEWSRRLGGAGSEYANACAVVDAGYLVLGYTTSLGAGSKDVFLVKLDRAGTELWSRTYGGGSWDVGTSLCPGNDGSYFICGFTNSFGWGEEDIYLIKIDQKGNELWSRTYGGFRIDMANSIHSTPEGGCVISASSGSYSANTDFFLTKIDQHGEQEWSHTYGAPGEHGHGFDWCKGSSRTRDGGYLITGYSDCNDMMDAVLVKTNDAGDEQWLRSFGRKPFYEYGNAACETDNGYVVVGITKSMVAPTLERRKTYNNDIFVAELSIEGTILWEITVGGMNADWANTVDTAEDGSLVILGHTDAGASGSLDVCFLKIAKRE